MNHEKFKQWMILDNYNELSEREITELNDHLNDCEACRKEYFLLRKDLNKISSEFKINNEDKILNEARENLRQFIVENRSTKRISLINDLLSYFVTPKVRFAFGGIAIFLLGFLLSYTIFNNSIDKPLPTNNNIGLLNEDGMKLRNINFSYTDPNTGDIKVNFDAIKPVTVTGNLKDKNIQNILMYSMLEEKNPGTRLNTISFIKNESNKQLDEEVIQTIITVVKYDKNPGVRMQALKLMNTFNLNSDVKDALIFVLMNDKNSAMRIAAINKLAEATNNGLLLQDVDKYHLKKLNTDNNNYVKLTLRKVLEEK